MRARFEGILTRLRRLGADYADIRRVENRRENLRVRNGIVLSVGGGSEAGFGIRVLASGSWGFAATDDGDRLERAADAAIATARASALACREPAAFSPAEAVVGAWSSTYLVDPFAVPLEQRIALLLEATEAMRTDDRIASAEGELSLFRQDKSFASTEGSWIEQSRTECGGGIGATAISRRTRSQRRSYPASLGGNHAARRVGIRRGAPASLRRRRGSATKRSPSSTRRRPRPASHDLVVGSAQLALQVHESGGHPTELDRVLGTELSLAGGSFLKPEMLGSFRYGSPNVNLVADATFPGGLGTSAGTTRGRRPRREPLVDRGILVGFLSSRETAARIGRADRRTDARRGVEPRSRSSG